MTSEKSAPKRPAVTGLRCNRCRSMLTHEVSDDPELEASFLSQEKLCVEQHARMCRGLMVRI